LLIFLFVAMALFWATIGEHDKLWRYEALTAAIALLIGAALVLNRQGRYRIAASICLAASLLGPWGSVALDPRILRGDLVPLVYTALPIFLASLLLSARHTMLVSAIQIGLLVGLSQKVDPHFADNWPSLIFFVLSTSILNLIASRLARLDLDQIDRQSRELDVQKIRLQAIVDFSPVAISVKDLDGRYQLINRLFEKAWGVSRSQVLGSRDADLFTLELARFHSAGDQAVLGGGALMDFEESIRQASGEQAWLTHKFPLRDERGRLYAIAAVSTDITDRRQREESVRRELHQQRESITRAANIQLRQTVSRVPCLPGLACAAVYEPSERLGGDFLYLAKDSERLLLVAADCTGHGLEASISSALLKSLVDRHLSLLSSGAPDAFLSSTGADVARYFPPGHFPVMFAALFDPATGALRYANANYPLPWVMREGRASRLAAVPGMHLGFDELIHYATGKRTLEPGESLLIHSDALDEILHEGVNLFPSDRLAAALSDWNGGVWANLAALCEAVSRVRPFPLYDDLSLVLLERLAPGQVAWAGATPEALPKIREDVDRLLARGGCHGGERRVLAENLAAFLGRAWDHGAGALEATIAFDGERLVLGLRERGAPGWAAPWVESVEQSRPSPSFGFGTPTREGKSRWNEERQCLEWTWHREDPRVISVAELLGGG
jgi:PAS domain S-box-containing protein